MNHTLHPCDLITTPHKIVLISMSAYLAETLANRCRCQGSGGWSAAHWPASRRGVHSRSAGRPPEIVRRYRFRSDRDAAAALRQICGESGKTHQWIVIVASQFVIILSTALTYFISSAGQSSAFSSMRSACNLSRSARTVSSVFATAGYSRKPSTRNASLLMVSNADGLNLNSWSAPAVISVSSPPSKVFILEQHSDFSRSLKSV